MPSFLFFVLLEKYINDENIAHAITTRKIVRQIRFIEYFSSVLPTGSVSKVVVEEAKGC